MSLMPDTGPWVASVTAQLASTDKRMCFIDFTAQLAANQTVTSPTCTLYDETAGAFVPASLLGAPTTVGNIVNQGVGGLTAGHRYRLRITYTPNPTAMTGEQGTGDLVIVCPT